MYFLGVGDKRKESIEAYSSLDQVRCRGQVVEETRIVFRTSVTVRSIKRIHCPSKILSEVTEREREGEK